MNPRVIHMDLANAVVIHYEEHGAIFSCHPGTRRNHEVVRLDIKATKRSDNFLAGRRFAAWRFCQKPTAHSRWTT